jgi:hypothetical protein
MPKVQRPSESEEVLKHSSAYVAWYIIQKQKSPAQWKLDGMVGNAILYSVHFNAQWRTRA